MRRPDVSRRNAKNRGARSSATRAATRRVKAVQEALGPHHAAQPEAIDVPLSQRAAKLLEDLRVPANGATVDLARCYLELRDMFEIAWRRHRESGRLVGREPAGIASMHRQISVAHDQLIRNGERLLALMPTPQVRLGAAPAATSTSAAPAPPLPEGYVMHEGRPIRKGLLDLIEKHRNWNRPVSELE